MFSLVSFENLFQVPRQRVGTDALQSLFHQIRRLINTQRKAVCPCHFMGDMGQYVYAGDSAVQHPILPFFPQQLPLQIVLDQRAATF